MNVEIDYLAYTEQVNISNDASDRRNWRALYGFICDYLPMAFISYSDWNITFPWRYFLSLKGFLGQYFLAHRSLYKVSFSDAAKAMLKTANDTSYSAALLLPPRDREDIEKRLAEAGFIRKLTDNQLQNLIKISHLPGAATFSVPGAGKTTEALAFFFINTVETDKLLVVAPKNAFGAWEEQLAACVGETHGKFVRLRGGETSIQTALQAKPRFMLITYDQLPRVKDAVIELLAPGNVCMFLDESYTIKVQ